MDSSLIDREHSSIFQTYKRLPVEIDHAEGCRVYAKDGTVYLDFLGGIAVNALGHSHPRIIDAVCKQAHKFMHVSNYFYQEPQIELAEKLKNISGFDRVYFCNSGSEAFESAVKLVRKWGNPQGKTEIIGFTGGFHGRTYAPLSVMDRPLYKDGMEPFLPNNRVMPFNDSKALREAVNRNTCAVALEFLQGEGGVTFATDEFVDTIEDLRREYGFLLIADEVQAGGGRTGTFFGYQHFNIRPDVVTMAKAIGGGLPLGATLAREEVARVWKAGMHGTTYGGNALACVAGLVVLEELEHGISDNVLTVGNYLKSKLTELQGEFPNVIIELRGHGMMQGIVVNGEALPIVTALLARGVIANATAGNVIRLLPPLTITNADVDEFIIHLREVLAD